MTPQEFADRCRAIVSGQAGHSAHRALDFLTNDALRALGYGEGIDIFEAAVAHWHTEGDPYPYQGPCPDCESAPHDPRRDPRRAHPHKEPSMTTPKPDPREVVEPFAWESTTPAYKRWITNTRYQKLRPAYQRWYRPICAKCGPASDPHPNEGTSHG